ncbi:MFS sugar transporter-like protein [Exophiala viscosa]|uniref:MFS sugar transporter-like protein n=1 Tax=Exophiala viscosa TaxID=2486360 RepID=A0AAN6DYL1_9EURO|nr:MFS sugar transporter-like protein [Exophiala viscosa]KAI1624077.1 MFS sugar transporter-like protein [Exophiala viscosa]
MAQTLGFDGSMMNGLNILPSYTDYFTLTTATLALNTASVWMGSVLSVFYARVPDTIGRKWALFFGALLTIIGVIIQTAAQNIAMFVIARIIIGFGTGASSIAGPVYLAETLPVRYRAWGLGIFYDFWYVGGLIAAGVTYGTAKMDSTWAWRTPSLLQCLFSFMCIAILPFVPESPRWLVSQGRNDEALIALAKTHSNGNIDDAVVLLQHREVTDTLRFEKTYESPSFIKQLTNSASTRKRVFLVSTVAIFCMLSGNNIVSYYLGTMLEQAGVTDSTTQLEINIILNAWCLVISIIGTMMSDKLGRKTLAAISTAALTVFLFIVGAMTKVYGNSTSHAGVYGTVASIFLFQGAYSFGWTPLTVLYPPEVLNYSIRSVGMAWYTFLVNGVGLMVTFAFPFALDAIGWKTYMINGAWDVLELVVVLITWVETRGRTLEEIDENLDGVVHSDVPKLQTILGVPEAEREGIVNALEMSTKEVEARGTVTEVARE